MVSKGLVYVFTGDGKGKTSAAIGVTVRSLLIDKAAVWISWYKSADWMVSEMRLSEKFPEKLKMHWMGKGFYIKNAKEAKVNNGKVFDYDTPEGHRLAALSAKNLALKYLKRASRKKIKLDLLILDEINQTIHDGLMKVSDIEEILKARGSVNVVMTGRNFPDELKGLVDLISEVNKVKHPFESGIMAEKGLDF